MLLVFKTSFQYSEKYSYALIVGWTPESELHYKWHSFIRSFSQSVSPSWRWACPGLVIRF